MSRDMVTIDQSQLDDIVQSYSSDKSNSADNEVAMESKKGRKQSIAGDNKLLIDFVANKKVCKSRKRKDGEVKNIKLNSKSNVRCRSVKKQKLSVRGDCEANFEKGNKDWKNVLTQRVSPKKFMSILRDMPASHEAAIKEIGFGGFLLLDLDTHNASFSKTLVNSFDVDRCGFILKKNAEIVLVKEDFKAVYGLPCGGVEIEDKQPGDNWGGFLEKWRGFFGLKKGSPSNNDVIAKIEQLKTEPLCEEFLLHFVLCAVNCCICSTTNQSLNYKFLYSCRNVNDIGKLDWCGFAYNQMLVSINDWKRGGCFFTGPLPFLLICYFDRLQRGNLTNPRDYPLISVWNKEKIKARMKVETERGFGNGKVLKQIDIPENIENESVNAREERVKRDGKNRTEERVNCESSKGKETGDGSASGPTEMLAFLAKFEDLAKTLGQNVNDMYDLLKKADSIFGEGELKVQMSTLIKNIWSKYTTAEEGTSQGPESEKSDGEGDFDSHTSSQDNQWFNEPAFTKELDDLVAKAYEKIQSEKVDYGKEKSNAKDSIPNFNLLSQSQECVPVENVNVSTAERCKMTKKSAAKDSMPNFNLLSQSLESDAIETMNLSTASTKRSKGFKKSVVRKPYSSKNLKDSVENERSNVDDGLDGKVNFDDDFMDLDNYSSPMEDKVMSVEENVNLETLPNGLPKSLMILSKWANDKLIDENIIQYTFEEEIFGHATKAVLYSSDIHDVVHMNKIGSNSIIFYMSWLYSVLKKAKKDDLVVFVDPNHTFGIGTQKILSERSKQLVVRLKKCKLECSIILLPYNPGGHWTLTAIDMKHKSVYWLDPLKRRLPSSKDWIEVVNSAIHSCEDLSKKKKMSEINWISLRGVPVQKDDKTCGFWIMRFMRDIVFDEDFQFVKKWEYKSGLKYEQSDIDEVRAEWADQVMNLTCDRGKVHDGAAGIDKLVV